MSENHKQVIEYTMAQCLVPKVFEVKPFLYGEPIAILNPFPKIHTLKPYVLRDSAGNVLDEKDDIVSANITARNMRCAVIVYKREGTTEVEMSYSGPGSSGRRTRKNVTIDEPSA